jgi:hypothetical protein
MGCKTGFTGRTLVAILCEEMTSVLFGGIPVGCEATLSNCWSKEAVLNVEDGKAYPWSPARCIEGSCCSSKMSSSQQAHELPGDGRSDASLQIAPVSSDRRVQDRSEAKPDEVVQTPAAR